MVKYVEPEAGVFQALGDPTRLRIVKLLLGGDRVISDLADPLNISLPGVLKQIHILEEAGLATTTKVGRTRVCRLNADPLEGIIDWASTVRHMWNARLDSLQEFLIETKEEAL